jgi:hypothetical protein
MSTGPKVAAPPQVTYSIKQGPGRGGDGDDPNDNRKGKGKVANRNQAEGETPHSLEVLLAQLVKELRISFIAIAL